LVSDVDVAICLIQAAVGALWINVDVNLKGMKNKAFGDGLKLKILNAMRRIRSFEPEPVRALLVG
jgi:formiminotetrahydrofolate cyclodeaminase